MIYNKTWHVVGTPESWLAEQTCEVDVEGVTQSGSDLSFLTECNLKRSPRDYLWGSQPGFKQGPLLLRYLHSITQHITKRKVEL